jgi:hypothetical protein
MSDNTKTEDVTSKLAEVTGGHHHHWGRNPWWGPRWDSPRWWGPMAPAPWWYYRYGF